MKSLLMSIVMIILTIINTLWVGMYTVLGMTIFLVWFNGRLEFWLIPLFGLSLDLIRLLRIRHESNNSSTGIE